MLGVLLLAVWGSLKFLWPLPPSGTDLVIPGYTHSTLKPLSGFDDPRLKRQAGEADLAYVRRVTETVYGAIYHCEPQRIGQMRSVGIGGSLNYLLPGLSSRLAELLAGFRHDLGILAPGGLKCGFCHQTNFVLAETLRRNGFMYLTTGNNGPFAGASMRYLELYAETQEAMLAQQALAERMLAAIGILFLLAAAILMMQGRMRRIKANRP